MKNKATPSLKEKVSKREKINDGTITRKELQKILGDDARYLRIREDSKIPTGSYSPGRRNRLKNIPVKGNYGIIPTGNLFVLDFDCHREGSSNIDDQIDFFSELFNLDLRDSLAIVTQTGGIHVFLRFPESVETMDTKNIPRASLRKYSKTLSETVGKEIIIDADIRSGITNGYVVGVTSSINGNGKAYDQYLLADYEAGFKASKEILTVSEAAVELLKSAVSNHDQNDKKRGRKAPKAERELVEEVPPPEFEETDEKGKINLKPTKEIIQELKKNIDARENKSFHAKRAFVKSALHCCHDNYSIALTCIELEIDRDSYSETSIKFKLLLKDIKKFNPPTRYHSVYCEKGRRNRRKKINYNTSETEENHFDIEEFKKKNARRAEERDYSRSEMRKINPRVIDAGEISKAILSDAKTNNPPQQYFNAMAIVDYFLQPLSNVGAVRVLLARDAMCERLDLTKSQVTQAMRVLRKAEVIVIEQKQRTGMAPTYSIPERFTNASLTKNLRSSWGLANRDKSKETHAPLYFDRLSGAYREVFTNKFIENSKAMTETLERMNNLLPVVAFKSFGAGAAVSYLKEEAKGLGVVIDKLGEIVADSETGEVISNHIDFRKSLNYSGIQMTTSLVNKEKNEMTEGLTKVSRFSNESSVSDLNTFSSDKPRTIKMSFNAAATGHLMERLTDMYPFPILATVREVISNATDATAKWGSFGHQVKAVEIEMPSSFSPEFVVRDHGIGMSPDTIENIFSTYGGSTKGEDFDQIGAFGLGAKAPLSYCKEFSFETTHEGITSKVIVSRLASGPETKIMSVEKTGAPSGTTMRIPVADSAEDFAKFAEAVKTYRALSFDVPVLIDGELFFGNENYVELDESILIESVSETFGRVWINKNSIDRILHSARGFNSHDNWTYSFFLSGYLYESPVGVGRGVRSSVRNGKELSYRHNSDSSDPYSDLIVELKPGVVNFTSSRDAIVNNERSDALSALVMPSINGISDYLFRNILELLKSNAFDDKTTYEIISSLNPEINIESNEVIFERNIASKDSSDGVLSVAINSFNYSDGVNVFENKVKFSEKIVSSMVTLNLYDKRRYMFLPESNCKKFVPAEGQDYIRTSFAITQASNTAVSRYNSNVGEDGHALSLIDLAFAVVSSDSRYSTNKTHYLFVVTGIKDEAEVKRSLRALTRVSDEHKVNVSLIFTNVDEVSDAEKVVFESYLDKGLAERTVHYVKPDFFKDMLKAAKPVEVKSDVTFRVAKKTDGLTSESEFFTTFVDSYSHTSSSFLNEIDDMPDGSIILLSKNTDVNVNVAVNGMRHDEGFDSIKGRAIYHVVDPLKAVMDVILSRDFTLVSLNNFDHASPAVSTALKEKAKRYHRSLLEDEFEQATDDQIFMVLYGNAGLDASRLDKINGFINLVAVNSNVENSEAKAILEFSESLLERVNKLIDHKSNYSFRSFSRARMEERMINDSHFSGLSKLLQVYNQVYNLTRSSYDNSFHTSISLLLNNDANRLSAATRTDFANMIEKDILQSNFNFREDETEV